MKFTDFDFCCCVEKNGPKKKKEFITFFGPVRKC